LIQFSYSKEWKLNNCYSIFHLNGIFIIPISYYFCHFKLKCDSFNTISIYFLCRIISLIFYLFSYKFSKIFLLFQIIFYLLLKQSFIENHHSNILFNYFEKCKLKFSTLKGTGTRDYNWLKVVSMERSWSVGLTDDH
jgi:hypothetical protein